jgi:hypothetical protein
MARRRLFVILQGFIDESYDDGGTFVLGGCIASAESWAAFTKDWEPMLGVYGLTDKDGIRYFKMSHMASVPERMARVPAFFQVIEKHIWAFVSAKINTYELRRALSRLMVPNLALDWSEFSDPYCMAYRALLDMFHTMRPKMDMGLPDDKIDFYFDRHTKKKAIWAAWDSYIQERPEEAKKYYGAMPRFEDDNDFKPLQAADFWAWWVRSWYNEGPNVVAQKMESMDFGPFKLTTERQIPRIDISFTEDQLVDGLKSVMRSQLPPDAIIYNVRVS